MSDPRASRQDGQLTEAEIRVAYDAALTAIGVYRSAAEDDASLPDTREEWLRRARLCEELIPSLRAALAAALARTKEAR